MNSCPIMLTPNEGSLDRKIRIVLGLIFVLLSAFVFMGLSQIISLIAGILMLMTGLTGFCGLYKLLGISTNKK